MAKATPAKVDIDIYSDVVCPWCYVGTERLQRAIAAAGLEGQVELRYHTYMLRPDTPDEGLDIHAELKSKYGRDPRQLFARVEAEAKEAGITLDLAKQPRMYPTARAHALLRHAEAKGTQTALSRDLFRAYFLEAKNIADPAVLSTIAAPHGFSADEVARLASDLDELAQSAGESDAAHAKGITGVPFFVFNGELAVSGAQPTSVFQEALNETLQRAG